MELESQPHHSLSGYSAAYFCPHTRNCQLTLKTRKSCQFCRYRLCEAAGMKAAWVLTDQERRRRLEEEEERDREIQSCDQHITHSQFFPSTAVMDLDLHLVKQLVRWEGRGGGGERLKSFTAGWWHSEPSWTVRARPS